MEALRKAWKGSKKYRVVLIIALVWFFIRLAFQIIYTAGLFPELTGDSGLPADLPVYMGAAQHFQLRQPIYPQDLTDSTQDYPYSPPYAMISAVLLWLPGRLTAMICMFAIVAAYVLIYFIWAGIFTRLKLERVRQYMAWTLPVWLIFAPFWGGVAYLNVGVIVVLVTSLLVKCILEERLSWAIPLLTFLLISKIMWAFPLAVPLLFGKRRFFFQLLGYSLLAYLGLVGLAMAIAGPAYILQQYGAYFSHLGRLTTDFPWQVMGINPYFGLNHSVKQTVVFLLGNKHWVLNLATLIKVLLLVPLIVIAVRLLLHPRQVSADDKAPSYNILVLDITFLLYLGAFIWLDIVWELLLGIVIFPYLLATLEKQWQKVLVWVFFLVYAFVDVIRLVSFGIGGDSVFDVNGEYILTDPSTYIPLTLFVLLLFYVLLARRTWRASKDISTVKA